MLQTIKQFLNNRKESKSRKELAHRLFLECEKDFLREIQVKNQERAFCVNCKFYNGLICRRFPTYKTRSETDWCGEHRYKLEIKYGF
jgi:hypothetical protein